MPHQTVQEIADAVEDQVVTDVIVEFNLFAARFFSEAVYVEAHLI